MASSSSKTRMTEEEMERMARENAALRIQRAWRGKIRETYLKPDFIWTDLASHAQMKVINLACWIHGSMKLNSNSSLTLSGSRDSFMRIPHS